ncbi:MAG: hypothetical protein ABJ004_12765 [Cyclobacteriaceae bacterium]
MKHIASLLLVFSVFLIVSCDGSEEPDPTDLGYDFYPINPAAYRIYQVDEIKYDLLGPDTTNYQIRETISDSLMSESGIVSYVLKREKRTDSSDVWQTDSLWTLRKDQSAVVITENNVPVIKLSFPVVDGKVWDGNALNIKPSQSFYYEIPESLIELYTLIEAERLVKVISADLEPNLVNQDQRFDVYASEIGLIEKNYITLNFCTANCESVGEVQSGRILNQYLIEYGEK